MWTTIYSKSPLSLFAAMVAEATASTASIERIWSAAKFQSEDRERLSVDTSCKRSLLGATSTSCPAQTNAFYAVQPEEKTRDTAKTYKGGNTSTKTPKNDL